MIYKFNIEDNLNRDELDNLLKKHYKFSLLNFTCVVSDALAEYTIFTKKIQGKSKNDIEKEILGLRRIKQNLIKELDNYIFKYQLKNWPNHILTEIKDFTLKEGQKYYISTFKLEPFFAELNSRIGHLKKDLRQFKYEAEFLKKVMPIPIREGRLRPISYTNQICFLWATAMKDKNENVHWEKIEELLNWFIYHLKNANYQSRIKPILGAEDGERTTDNLKRLYRRIKKKYPMILKITSSSDYFPWWDNKPHRPNLPSIFPDGRSILLPVVSIKFYKDRIKTIFKVDDKLKAKETFFEQDKFRNIIRDYNPDEEKQETDELLLDIS